ncbi:hypothetical protein F8M41_020992 [Gigaspora margarita]|uniref:Uncharacterized protein n=1 Tax=Gigaspora margarita TaxID=4874 RepID=A0A8H4EVH9_GIGMA|nr:hypothetical protein F8M41_020992 [Gigaspora margarita]
MISSENKLETNTLAHSWNETGSIPLELPKEVSINGYNMINAKFIALKDSVLNHLTSNFSDKEREKFCFLANKYTTPNSPEGSQSKAEISWPNPIEINFICKIIPNDVATMCCKISLPLEKIVQVPSAIIDRGQIAQLSQKVL